MIFVAHYGYYWLSFSLLKFKIVPNDKKEEAKKLYKRKGFQK